MKAKTMIRIAVASALSCSYGAWADVSGSGSAGNYGHMGMDSTYGVVTPFSPNEAGPTALPHGDRYADLGTTQDAAGLPVAAVVTPLQDNEAGPHEFTHERSPIIHTAGASSMANPMTPWSPSEGGLNTFHEDIDRHAQQLAELEQARVAAAEWNARVAAGNTGGYDVSASASEPFGSTDGAGLRGSMASRYDPSGNTHLEPALAPDVRSEAQAPADVDRTSALRREGEVAVYEYNTVGILEVPAEPHAHTVWSVEPLAPGADIARGDTIYLPPEGPEVSFVPRFEDSGTMSGSGDRAAELADGDAAPSGASL